MFPRRLGYEFAILAVLCTVALLLFPAEFGPYSAVHGPATVLASFRSRLRLWWWIALSGMSPLSRLLRALGARIVGVMRREWLLPETPPPEHAAVLRC